MPSVVRRRAGRTAPASRCGRGWPGSRARAGCRGTARRAGPRAPGSASGSNQSRRASQVDVLGERLGQPVGQRLDHDRPVVVVLGLVLGGRAPRRRGSPPRSRPGGRRPGRRSRPGSGWRGPPASSVCWRSIGNRHAVGPARCRRPRRAPARSRTRPRAWNEPSAMISSSSVLASSYSSRATGWSRIAGYLPFSSQARNRNCQSIISRSSARAGSTARTPVNAGIGRSSKSTCSRLARACARVSSGCACRLACCSRSRSCSARFAVVQLLGPVRVEQVGHHADHPGRVEHVHGRPVVRRARSAPPCAAGTWWRRRSAAAASGRGAASRRRPRPSRPATG